jgi:hypothetical protein
LAFGVQSFADGTDVMALGAGARATGSRATAVGVGAATTRDNQVMLGTASDEVTVANLAGSGKAIVEANSDGTLKRSSLSTQKIINTFDGMQGDINRVENNLGRAARGLGAAAESAGAVGAALSGLPEVSLLPDEPARCGFAGGGYGSQYSVAGGCALRIKDRFHLNGAIAYTPSVDYVYGSTSSVAGRIGFSFPLGKIAKATASNDVAQAEGSPAFQAYLSEMEGNLDALQSDVELRDQQIDALKTKLDALINGEASNQQQGTSITSEATTKLIAMLKEQIKQLEEEKRASDAEDEKQNALIEDLQAENQSLRKNMTAIMRKLGMK